MDWVHWLLLLIQICPEIWYLLEDTHLVVLMTCGIKWLLSHFIPYSDYARVKCFPGRIFKTVRCHVTVSCSDHHTVYKHFTSADVSALRSSYLGVKFHLEKKEGHILHVDQKMCYYITDKIWYSLLDLAEAAPNTVFLKRGYEPFSRYTAMGSVMSLSDVLDSLVLHNHSIKLLDAYHLLPINMSPSSDDKFFAFLNFLAVYMETPLWVSLALSGTSAVFFFIPCLRHRLYDWINRLFCWAFHLICDRLRRSTRRRAYKFGESVNKRLHPNSERGDICAVIGGGAKVDMEGASLVIREGFQGLSSRGELNNVIKSETFSCGDIDVDIDCFFDVGKRKCLVTISDAPDFAEVDCDEEEYAKLLTFISCLAENCRGSLHSFDSKSKAVGVRRLRESITCYAQNGFPPVYQLKLENVVVN